MSAKPVAAELARLADALVPGIEGGAVIAICCKAAALHGISIYRFLERLGLGSYSLVQWERSGPRGNVYLHRWLRSDRKDAHDHPWLNETFVLAGRLVEELFCPRRMALYASGRAQPIRRELKTGMSAMREADAIHRIVEVEPGTITLFTTRAKVRDWGFWESGRFVPWREYHGLHTATPADWRAGAALLEAAGGGA